MCVRGLREMDEKVGAGKVGLCWLIFWYRLTERCAKGCFLGVKLGQARLSAQAQGKIFSRLNQNYFIIKFCIPISLQAGMSIERSKMSFLLVLWIFSDLLDLDINIHVWNFVHQSYLACQYMQLHLKYFHCQIIFIINAWVVGWNNFHPWSSFVDYVVVRNRLVSRRENHWSAQIANQVQHSQHTKDSNHSQIIKHFRSYTTPQRREVVMR